jgi:molybdenum cofactor sulfurtransferase
MPILLSNESPVLTISSSSLNRLNEQIKSNGGKAVRAEAFRANIVVGETKSLRLGPEQPYAEDTWRMIRIANQYFEFLGPCRRCQMVCIDQDTGKRNQEPFTTLAKTRRYDGKIFFGQHCSHVPSPASTQASGTMAHAIATIATGDAVYPIL